MVKVKKTYNLKIPSQKDNLEIIRNFISAIARKVGFKDEDVNKIELAVDEACTNVIRHAYEDDETQNIDIAIKIDFQKLDAHARAPVDFTWQPDAQFLSTVR